MRYRKGVGGMDADAEAGYTVSKERINPIRDVRWEALVSYDLGQPCGVKVVVEP